MKYKVFNTEVVDMLSQPMFFGSTPNTARYDIQKYPIFEKQIDKMLGYFWRPQEVDLTQDSKDFKGLTDHERHIFLSNLQRQILLDSVQGRSPNMAMLPHVSLPELETLIETWSFFETIHSRSYTYIIQNVYPNPTEVFDSIMTNEHIVNDATEITKYYDSFIEYGTWYNLLGEGTHVVNGSEVEINEYELKTRLYKMLVSVNILEGDRFYVSFACSWAFAQQQNKMEGNAKIIKFICRDENLHLATTQTMLKNLVKEDPTYAKIAEECNDEIIQMYTDAVDQEKSWAAYLFKDGSLLGLNEQLLCDYVEYIANRRLRAIGLPQQYKQPNDPLSWTKHWINSDSVQVAPQETEITSYTVGEIKQDVETGETFKDFVL
jgi:ribonucleoside-diphosphate reductase beta chain